MKGSKSIYPSFDAHISQRNPAMRIHMILRTCG
jgi:hypothetical protein